MRQVTANVYIECGLRGCNLGFVTTREGIVMIDTPPYPTDAMKWREEISKSGEVRYLINTDSHRDHNLGNYFFPGICISHKEGRETLLLTMTDQVMEMVRHRDPGGLRLMEGYHLRLPDITFTENLNLYLGDHIFQLINLPGHASGVIGICVPEERVVFASDCLFYREKSYLHEAMPYQWIESLKRLGEVDADVIIPGHGEGVCKKEYLEEQANIIRSWIDVVKAAIDQDLSAEEAAVKIRCPDPYALPKQVPWTESELNKKIIDRLYNVLNT